MKVIDVETRGNVVKLYLGENDCFDYWGDDWDDVPAELNAGPVYEKYVVGNVEFAFPMKFKVCLYSDNNDGSPYCKEDFKMRIAPYLVIVRDDEEDWYCPYSKYAGSQSNDVIKIYYEDDIEELEKKILAFGGVILCAKVSKF